MFSVLLICMAISFVKANNGRPFNVCSHGSYFNGPSGTISSPNFPNHYTNSIDCYSYINVSTGHYVAITFIAFNTQASSDFVTFECTSGKSYTSPRYSGSQIPDVFRISSCSGVTVSFHTDHSGIETGFLFAFDIKRFCETKIFSEPNGTISSPNNPNVYENNIDCYSYISVSSGHSVNITFLSVYTQRPTDWLQITCASGNNFTSPRYSGYQNLGGLTIHSCSLVNVSFHTDGDTNYYYYGFRFNYTIISVCGTRNYTETNGTVVSPNYPNAYDNNLDCYSYISFRYQYSVVIRFLAFSTESEHDWVTITCASRNSFTSPRYSGSEFPTVLMISSCSSIKVSFHTSSSNTETGFSLQYRITGDNAIGGITTKPLNAFPRTDKNSHITFNCTTRVKYLPWWTIDYNGSNNYTITNSTCGVITSAPYSYWFTTETLGPGSCNLIVSAPANTLHLLAGSVFCTDSTLSSARAILAPISPELRLATRMNSSVAVADLIRDEEMRISCNPSFIDGYSSSSLAFTYSLYRGGPVMQMNILRTYWTSEGNAISSIHTSNTSSYVIVKGTKDGFVPPYTCNIICNLLSNNSDEIDNSIIEISFNTDPVNFKVLYAMHQSLKLQVLILGPLLGVAVLTTIVILAIIVRPMLCRQPKVNTDVGHKSDGNGIELRRKGVESNVYDNDTEYDNLDTAKRRLPDEPDVYQALQVKKKPRRPPPKSH